MPEIDANSSFTDAVSPLGHEILQLDPAAYTRLVVHGSGYAAAKEKLRKVAPGELLAAPVVSLPDAKAMLSGLWLWHDWLDESHVISQGLKDRTGSFWHAIMHRREGDFSNSKYWYDRCGEHPVMRMMTPFAGDLLNQMPAHNSLLRLVANGWSPESYVELVEAIHDSPEDPRCAVAVRLQQLEWRLLFEHCMRAASGQ